MAATNGATWTAKYEVSRAFPMGKDEDGMPKRVMVSVRAIYLSKVGAAPSAWTIGRPSPVLPGLPPAAKG